MFIWDKLTAVDALAIIYFVWLNLNFWNKVYEFASENFVAGFQKSNIQSNLS